MLNDTAAAALFAGEGQVLAELRRRNWDESLLGPVSDWPRELRDAARICLHSGFQMAVLCGDRFVYLYNDAASSLFGDKHPWALGQPVAVVWPEAWPTVGPMLESVLSSGKATRSDDLLLVLVRNGRTEECYLTFSYSPIFLADGSVGGVFVAFMETTRRVLAERRQRATADLATQVALRGNGDNPLALMRAALERHPYDLPLSALVLTEPGHSPGFGFVTGLASPLPPQAASELLRCATRCLSTAGSELFDTAGLLAVAGPCGPWPVPPRQLIGIPFRRGGEDAPAGVLLLGVSPYIVLDTTYRSFLESVAGQVSHAVAIAEADVAEARRRAAIAELERSRSQFFASASHEMRTPLTLILGPLGTLLEQHDEALPEPLREPLGMAYRNAQRLHKLVGSLMDFAIIEAGSLPLALAPVDAGAVTAEIASLFRSAVEAAGLELVVDCGAARGEVLLDRDMWEKIVFNLLSNAFKYTPSGRIEVSLARQGDALQLAVADTGVGVAPGEATRIFERFYRGCHAAGRAAEGSGVGLALVQELVRLHGGEAGVASVAGEGACFTVTVPWRTPSADAPHRNVRLGTQGHWRSQFKAELDRYGELALPGLPVVAQSEGQTNTAANPGADAMRVVVIDDDRDVVRYISRLLAGSCSVMAAHDADTGLAAIRWTKPDLVLLDLMMPGVDGLELVRRIRAEPPIHTVPLVVLSARAGEEARLEALHAGADDYLVKPFSARELIARVRGHVQMARVRRAAVEQEGALRRQIDRVKHDLAKVLEGTSDSFIGMDRELRVLSMNDASVKAFGMARSTARGRHIAEVLPSLADDALMHSLGAAVAQSRAGADECYFIDGQRWYEARCYPSPNGVIMFANDITARKRAEQELRRAHAVLEHRVARRTAELSAANQLLAAVFDRAPGGIAVSGLDERLVQVNDAYAKLTGLPVDVLHGRSPESWIEAAGLERLRAGYARLVAGACDSFQAEARYRLPDGRRVWVAHFVSMIGNAWRGEQCFVTIAWDITARKRSDAERHTSARELRLLYERLQTVREAERTALAREVHDQLGQILSAAKIDIKLLEDELRAGPGRMDGADIVRELGSASTTLERAITLVREIATELRAPALDEQGLYAAVDWHARDFERRTRIACHVAFDPRRRHPSRAAAAALLRIFQEAVANVLRHAQATGVWIGIEARAGHLVLRVRDNGVGIAPGPLRRAGALGLRGMRERAELVDGRLWVRRLLPSGTLVSARVPLQNSKEPA